MAAHGRLCAARTRLSGLINRKKPTAARPCPAHRNFADPYGDINDIERNPRAKPQFGEKNPRKCMCSFSYSPKFNISTAYGTENQNLFKVRLKQSNALHAIPLQSLPL